MKYCVSGRQPLSTLRQADEIKMMYKDYKKLADYAIEMPDKTYIVEVPKNITEIDFQFFTALSESIKIIFAVQDMKKGRECKERGFDFYWDYPIFTWFELDTILLEGPCYIFLTAPLCFSLRDVRYKTEVPIRLCVNLAQYDYLQRDKGLYGPFVRPEDISIYETWVSAVEFKTDDLGIERTLLKVYKDDKQWPGNLNLLLTNFNINIDNRVLPEEFGERRANCHQRCMQAKTCYYCDTAVMLASALRDKYYNDLKTKQKEDI